MYQQTSISSEIESGCLSVATQAYLGRRAQNKYYDFVMEKFKESGMTQADLARRTGKGNDRINRLLSNPGNWTVETMAVLIAGICGEEIIPHSAPFANRARRNMRQIDVVDDRKPEPTPISASSANRSQPQDAWQIQAEAA